MSGQKNDAIYAATVAFAVAKMRELGWMPPSNTSTDPPQDAWKAHRVEENGRALLRDQEEGHEQ